MTDKWRVEGKDVFKSRQINIHLNKNILTICYSTWTGFRGWDTDARESQEKKYNLTGWWIVMVFLLQSASFSVSTNLMFPLVISGPNIDISKHFIIYVISSSNGSCIVSGEGMIALKAILEITEIMLVYCSFYHYGPTLIYLKVTYLTECQLNKWHCSKGHT